MKYIQQLPFSKNEIHLDIIQTPFNYLLLRIAVLTLIGDMVCKRRSPKGKIAFFELHPHATIALAICSLYELPNICKLLFYLFV